MTHTHPTIGSLMTHAADTIDHLDRSLIIAHVIGKERTYVLSHLDACISSKQHEQIEHFFTMRANGYPLAYIVGEKDFYNRTFSVTEDTLIPRPETEIMIEDIMQFCASIPPHKPSLIIDIGTGSGAIITTLAASLPHDQNHTYIATDISSTALEVASHNMRTYQVEHLITTYHADLLNDNSLKKMIIEKDPTHMIIAANLPYVDHTLRDQLLTTPQSRGLAFEPPLALWSHENGCAHYYALITQTLDIKKFLPHTTCTSFYEIDPAQETLLSKKISSLTSHVMQPASRDLAHKPRILSWQC